MGFSAYPSGSSSSEYGVSRKSQDEGFRSATPDDRGRYANAVYDELESQNDEQVSVMTEKVKMLKNVRLLSVFPEYSWICLHSALLLYEE